MLVYCDSVILMYYSDHTGAFNVRASNRLAALAAAEALSKGPGASTQRGAPWSLAFHLSGRSTRRTMDSAGRRGNTGLAIVEGKSG
jgi:hypothetical protein